MTPFAVEQVARLLKSACARQDVVLQRLVSDLIRDISSNTALFGTHSVPEEYSSSNSTTPGCALPLYCVRVH